MSQTNEPIKWDVRADRAVLILLVLCLVAFALHKIVAYDVWWQLATGQLVRQNGWPETDPFSFGFPDRIWIEVRWLYCVTISIIYEKLGLNFLIIAKILCLLLTGAVLRMAGGKDSRWAVHLGLACAIVLVHQRMVIRPELVSFLFLAGTLLCLRKYQLDKDWRWMAALPILQIIWVNTHTLYALGPAVLWLFAGGEWLSGKLPWTFIRSNDDDSDTDSTWKILAIAAVAASLACLANPYGFRGAAFAFELFTEIQSNHVLSEIITEFRSPFANPGLNLLFVGYLATVLISAAGFYLRRRTLPLSWFLLWAAFLYLSVLAERNIPLFGIVACLTIMVNYGQLSLSPRIAWSARTACILLALVMVPALTTNYYHRAVDPDRRFGFGIAERRFPLKAMAFVEHEKLPRPVLANLGESAYLIFESGPKSVYIDGRLEVYGGPTVAEAMKVLGTGQDLNQTAERLNVSTAVVNFEEEGPLLQVLLKDVTWAAVYYDESHVVFVRVTPATQELVSRLRVDWAAPKPITQVDLPANIKAPDWLAGIIPPVAENASARALGQLFMSVGNTAKAQEYAAIAVQQWPDDPIASLQLGVLYRAQKRDAEAAVLLSRVPPAMWQERRAQLFAAETYEAFGNNDAAVDAWLQLIALGERTLPVYQRLARAATASQRWDAAYTALDELSKSTPNDAKLWTNLGLIADKLNRKQDALRALGRSVQLAPNQAPIFTQIGVIKRELGDVNGARQAFQQALAIDPSFQPANQQLEALSPK